MDASKDKRLWKTLLVSLGFPFLLFEQLFWYEDFVVYFSAEASVEADPKNKKAAGIMLLSLAPFLMVTFSEIFDSRSHIIVLITLIISVSSIVVYFVYSV